MSEGGRLTDHQSMRWMDRRFHSNEPRVDLTIGLWNFVIVSLAR